MAKILKRTWSSTGPLGRKVKHVAYGYTFYRADGERERKVSSAWLTEHDALTALNARLAEIEAGPIDRPAERTFGALIVEYLADKRDHGKRPLKDDERILERVLRPVLGAGTLVRAPPCRRSCSRSGRRAGFATWTSRRSASSWPPVGSLATATSRRSSPWHSTLGCERARSSDSSGSASTSRPRGSRSSRRRAGNPAASRSGGRSTMP